MEIIRSWLLGAVLDEDIDAAPDELYVDCAGHFVLSAHVHCPQQRQPRDSVEDS